MTSNDVAVRMWKHGAYCLASLPRHRDRVGGAETGSLGSPFSGIRRGPQEILAQVGNRTVEKVTRSIEDEEVVYEVDWKRGQTERSLTVAEDGTLLSRQVFLTELAPPVQAKIRSQMVGGGKLVDIFWSNDAGEISYEVDVLRRGKSHSFGVAPDGTLVSLQVDLAETPAPVRKTIQERIGAGTPGPIYWALEDEEVFYLVETTRNGKAHSFSVGPDGEFLSSAVPLSETPAPVQKAIKQHLGNGRLGAIDREEEGGAVTFDVKMLRNGQRRSFNVAADGTITSMQVLLSETPGTVQKTINEQTAAGRIVRIDRSGEANQVEYEVEAKKENKRFVFTVRPDGKLQGVNQ